MRPRHCFYAVPCDNIDFYELDIQWLNASTNSSNLRAKLHKGVHGQSHGYCERGSLPFIIEKSGLSQKNILVFSIFHVPRLSFTKKPILS